MDSNAETRLAELGLLLPPPMATEMLPFELVRIDGPRALLSGHIPFDHAGRLWKPLGKVGADVTEGQAVEAAGQVALCLMASLQQALGTLDRVDGWLRLFGMVNVAPGFTNTTAVINGASERILEVFGADVGQHVRSAIGVAALPLNAAVEVEAEVRIRA